MERPVVVFDYDGTLVDTFAAKQAAYTRAVMETLAVDEAFRALVEASYARTSGAHRLTQLAETAAELGVAVTDAQREEFSRRFSAYNAALADGMPEFPSARRVLHALAARYDLVLTSGMPHEALLADAERRGLATYFFRVEGGDKGATLDRLRAEGRRVVLMVGDTPHDASVADSRGVPFYRVSSDADLARLLEALL
jgi:phosphoglycolate phosphatase-like HAD superfamily hydrolase